MRKRFLGIMLFLTAVLTSCNQFEEFNDVAKDAQQDLNGETRANNSQTPLVVGYFPSWSETYPTAAGSRLRNMPEEVTHIFLSFIKPNMRYTKGSFDIKGVGIEVPYDGIVLKETVDHLKAKGIKVILSIGGETYWGTDESYDIDFVAVADFVRDFGFDGIDWDYEPNGGFQTIGEPINVQRFITMIRESRKLLPKEEGFLIACAPAGCGALGRPTPYANNDDPTSPYAYAKRGEVTGDALSNEYNATAPEGYTISLYGFASTGHMIPVFKEVGHDIDFVAFQGYNTGSASQREIMYDSYAYYANIYGFRVAFGMHVPAEPWGPYYTYTEDKVREYTAYVAEGGRHNRAGKGDGVMFWQLLQVSAVDRNMDGIKYSQISYEILENHSPVTTPSVSIISPIANTLVRESESFNFVARVKRATKAEFYVDNILVATATAEPFQTTISNLEIGTHDLKVVVSNAQGETATATSTIKVISDDSVEDLPLWNKDTVYATGGTLVLYSNKVWSNKWWTQGDIPGQSDVWAFVRNVGEAGGDTDNGGDNGNNGGDNGNTGGGDNGNTGGGDNGNTGGGDNGNTGGGDNGNTGGGDNGNTGGGDNSQIEEYDINKTYSTAGTVVTYQGKKYRNKWWVNPGEVPGNPNGPWELILENGEGTTPDKALEYDINATYPTAGTHVIYNGKTYKNKWYVSAGDYPGKDQWGPWELVTQ